MDQPTGQDANMQVKVFAALWRSACRKAIWATKDHAPDQTGGDPRRAYDVMNIARAIFYAQHKEG